MGFAHGGGDASPSNGGVAEWPKAAVLKTVNRKVRGFESYPLRHGFRMRILQKIGTTPNP